MIRSFCATLLRSKSVLRQVPIGLNRRSLSIFSKTINENPITSGPNSFHLPSLSKKQLVDLPAVQYSYISIYDQIPLLNVNLPCINDTASVIREIKLPSTEIENEVKCKGGILKIRRKKMNKHKLKKRRKRDRAQIRKVLIGRERNRRRSRAKRKIRLVDKIKSLQEADPKSTYAERPYVIHRLNKW